MLVEVVGDEGSVYAVDKVYPFPLAARDQTCVVWAELANEDRKEFVMFGDGFEPGEQVTVRSTDGDDPKQWTESVNDTGGFAVSVRHRKSGGAGVFSAAGKHCAPTLPYEYGKKAERQ